MINSSSNDFQSGQNGAGSAGGGHLRLRKETAACHDRVDAVFSRFDLSNRDDYRHFLNAQARALAAIEPHLDAASLWQGWTPRLPLLQADLADFALALPAPVDAAIPEDAAPRWGMLYVIEGSRLGGAVLVKQVRPAFPTRFLNPRAVHGLWRDFLRSLDTAAGAGGEAWSEAAVQGAINAFDLFRTAGEAEWELLRRE